MLSFLGTRLVRLSCLLMAFAMLMDHPRAAGTIQLAGGVLDMSPGPLSLQDSSYSGRRFTFQSHASRSSGLWGPDRCNGDPAHCRPGDVLDLLFSVGGNDLPGTATLDGVTYSHVGSIDSPNQMNVQFTGSTVLPPMAASATITASFNLTGTFTHTQSGSSSIAQEDLTGRGTATISLVPDQGTPASWFVAHVRYTLSWLPIRWQSVEVGALGIPGYAFQGPDGDLFMGGSGADIWGTADGFRFVYQPIRGDGDISAFAFTQENTHPFAKTGVMLRQTVAPGSPMVILDIKPDGGVEFMKRSSENGATTFIAGGWVPVNQNGSQVSTTASVQLTRTGGAVTASLCSLSGGCQPLASTQWLVGPALIGAAVTSTDQSKLNHAYFPASLPTVHTLPQPWQLTDIGAVGRAGSAEASDGVFRVSGAGSDIWGTADSFTAVTQPITGDGEVAARVLSEENTHRFAKAGVMLGGLTPSSARVIIDVKPDGGIEFMARLADGSAMSFLAGAAVSFPVYLRLTRSGDRIEGFTSTDAGIWTPIGFVDLALPSTVPGGLAVTSINPSVLNTATFDHVIGFSPARNLMVNGGFEQSAVPALGPGWVSDAGRQSPAQSETAEPQNGVKNGACRTTRSLDCGIYQDIVAPATGLYTLTTFTNANKFGGLVGWDIDGAFVASTSVTVGAPGSYNRSAFSYQVTAGRTIHVWMYSSAAPGSVVIDDVILTYQRP
jgi:hypothetical protein